MEFATLRAAQNIVILPYYSTLHIQMQLQFLKSLMQS